MDESKKVGGGLDFMEVVLGVIGALTVALGVLVIIVGLVNVNISGLILGGIVIGSELSCLAVAAVLQILKDIRTELKTLSKGGRIPRFRWPDVIGMTGRMLRNTHRKFEKFHKQTELGGIMRFIAIVAATFFIQSNELLADESTAGELALQLQAIEPLAARYIELADRLATEASDLMIKRDANQLKCDGGTDREMMAQEALSRMNVRIKAVEWTNVANTFEVISKVTSEEGRYLSAAVLCSESRDVLAEYAKADAIWATATNVSKQAVILNSYRAKLQRDILRAAERELK